MNLKTILEWARRAWSVLRPLDPPVVVLRLEDSPPWTDKDAANLRAFFDTETGRRIQGTLRSLTVQSALVATSRREGGDSLEWDCGHASGIRDAAGKLDAMASVPERVEERPDDRPTDDLNWTHGRPESDPEPARRTG